MKAIALSIRPEWVEKILNGEKTIEIRKMFPRDYVGWVYIYCTKGGNIKYLHTKSGKIVARFWCDKIEETFYEKAQDDCSLPFYESCACITDDQLWNYVKNNGFFALYITRLEIFDSPKDLHDFKYYKYSNNNSKLTYPNNGYICKVPQNFCYIEGEE